MSRIDSFTGEYRFLSNFWPARLTWDNVLWPTSEHAYQAAKTLDPVERELIRYAPTPGRAKRMGRGVTMRSDWDNIKLSLMKEILYAKFRENPDLAEKLRLTGNAELIEGNTWGDTYWGVCRGVGENNLGKILTEIRDGLSVSD